MPRHPALCCLLLFCTMAWPGTAMVAGASTAPDSKHWTVQIDVPTNCSMPNPVSAVPALIACGKPCNVTGSTNYYVMKGNSLTISFQARAGVVIIGGSQNLGFMDDTIEDMQVMTAAAPANPITPVTYTGFRFAPRKNYYQTLQAGVQAKLAIYAFDATRPSHNKTVGFLGKYETASCRTFLELRLISAPPNATVKAHQLYTSAHTQAMNAVQQSRVTAIVVPTVIGGFIAAVIVGCLALGLAKKGSAVLPK